MRVIQDRVQEELMPACGPLLPKLRDEIQRLSDRAGLRRTAGKRLTLLVASLLEAQSVRLRKLGEAAIALELTEATAPEDVIRTLHAILNDHRLTMARFSHPLLREVIDWDEIRRGGGRLRVIIDDSALRDRIHLLRIGLAYRGTVIVLAFRVWEQNVPQPAGDYWRQLDAAFAEVQALLPPDLPVLVLADRAFDVPGFLDRVTALGWDYVVRLKHNSALKVETDEEVETFFREVVAGAVPTPGSGPWQGECRLFKKAGWRTARVAMIWEPGQHEPLVVCSSLPASQALLGEYRFRFWIEPGFKTDKSAGWDWEASQVRTPARHERLLLAMAIASLFTLILGAVEAERQCVDHPPTGHCYRTRPHAPASLFTLGLRQLRAYLHDPTRRLPPLRVRRLTFPSWNDEWRLHRLGTLAA
jgi:hypothetical protein